MVSVDQVWQAIKDRVDMTEEEFRSRVAELADKLGLTKEGAALLLAKRLGVDVSDILRPPIIGRVLEVRGVRETRGGIEYRAFSLVNEKEYRMCVAFGHEHVAKLEDLEDRAVKISKYVTITTPSGQLTRVTESSTLEQLSDDVLPPIYELQPARAPTLAKLKEARGLRIAEATVIEQQTTQIWTCPLCGREVLPADDEWSCPIHGPVEPEVRSLHRLQLADRSGIHQAQYMGQTGNLEGKKILFKAGTRGEEIYIAKIYKTQEVEI